MLVEFYFHFIIFCLNELRTVLIYSYLRSKLFLNLASSFWRTKNIVSQNYQTFSSYEDLFRDQKYCFSISEFHFWRTKNVFTYSFLGRFLLALKDFCFGDVVIELRSRVRIEVSCSSAFSILIILWREVFRFNCRDDSAKFLIIFPKFGLFINVFGGKFFISVLEWPTLATLCSALFGRLRPILNNVCHRWFSSGILGSWLARP